MCIKVEACSESARCPHVRSRRYEASVCGNPYLTPHTDGESQSRGLLVGLHRGKGVAPRSEAWIVDGDSGSPAGRRRLDATERPPINTRAGFHLLPAASFGASDALSHSQSLCRLRW